MTVPLMANYIAIMCQLLYIGAFSTCAYGDIKLQQ